MKSNPTRTQDELKRKRLPFTIVENSIIKDTSISKYALLVYVVLCMHADNDSSTCFPSYNTIAQYARCVRSTVQKAVQELVDKGYVQKRAQTVKGKKESDSNLYLITGKAKRQEKEGVPSSGTPIPSSGIGYTVQRYTGVPSSGKELDSVELDSLNKRENAAPQPPPNRDVYHFFEQTFKKANPDYFKYATKKVYGKEGPALQKLETIALDKPNPMAWAQDFVATAQRMKKSGDKMYASWPFLPSTLASGGVLPRILDAMKQQEVSPEIREIAERMFN